MAHSPAFAAPQPLCKPSSRNTPPSTCTSATPISMARRRRSRSRPKRPSKPTSNSAASQQQQQPSLVDHFEEDVKSPLSAKRPPAQQRRQSLNLNPLASLKDISLPNRSDTLNLLVKGAWVGIGILVGTFVVVHFVIVRDFLPK